MNKPQIVAAPGYPIPEWFPKGTTASRCTGCGDIALNVPGNLTDPWKKHFDYCPAEEDCTKGKHGPVYHGGAYPMDVVSAYPLVYIVWIVGEYGLIMYQSTTDRALAERTAGYIDGIVTTNVIVHDARKDTK